MSDTPRRWREFAPNIDGVVDEGYRTIQSGIGYEPDGWSITGFIPAEDAALIAAAPALLEALNTGSFDGESLREAVARVLQKCNRQSDSLHRTPRAIMNNANDSAFPIPLDDLPGAYQAEPGLTKREYFAAMAMQGFCAGPERPDGADIAKYAVQVADHLLIALEATPAAKRESKS